MSLLKDPPFSNYVSTIASNWSYIIENIDQKPRPDLLGCKKPSSKGSSGFGNIVDQTTFS